MRPSRLSQSLGSGPRFGVQVYAPTAADLPDTVRDLGATWTVYWVRWGDIQPALNQWTWETFDAEIAALKAAVPNVRLHMMTECSALTEPPPEGGPPACSMPPLDLSVYAEWLRQVRRRAGTAVDVVAIDNEVIAESVWGGTQDDYFAMARAAVLALRSEPSPPQVTDAGLSSSSIAIWMAREMVDTGQAEQAAQFLNDYWRDHSPKGLPIFFPDGNAVRDFLNLDDTAAVVAWKERYFRPDSLALWDALQLHYYAPWETLTRALVWVRGKLQAAGHGNKPIHLWEHADGLNDRSLYDTQRHARGLVKRLVLALAEGVRDINYWRLEEDLTNRAPGLLAHDGRLTSAGRAFQEATTRLTRATSVTMVPEAAGIWRYRFERAGQPALTVLWSTQPASIPIPVGTRPTVRDMYGAEVAVGSRSIPTTESPLWVEGL